MLEGGEDARFIARRLVILASEDVGLADPLALVVADAAARAVEFVGLPEAQLNLAQAVVHLAVRPQVEPGHGGARRGPRPTPGRGRGATCPPTSATPTTPGPTALGHGEGYRYPHDDPRGWVDQDYRPPEVADHVYYEPSDHGAEAALGRAPAASPARGLDDDPRTEKTEP